MMLGYADKKTQAFAEGEFVSAFQGFADQAAKRMSVLDAATSVDDLRKLGSNRLEALSGSRQGQFSIRINKQWRIWFVWPSGENGPGNVQIVDYR
jgi:toxin HigB-1